MMLHDMVSSRLRPTTTFTSWILGKPVHDADGRILGKLHDFLVTQAGEAPVITGLVLKDRSEVFQVPATALSGHSLPLTLIPGTISRTPVPEEGIHLVRDVLDAQVIDTQGAKVIRVNDVQLDWISDRLAVSGLDIGPWGIARRMGVARGLAWLVRTFGLQVAEGLLPWSAIVPMSSGFHSLRLQLPSSQIRGLHPADLAEIVEELGHAQREQLLTELSDAQVADLVEESDQEMQVAILNELGLERAADVLEEMEPDEAADLLADLPEKQAQDLMERMEASEAAEVRELLTHPEGTAGAMMTPAFIQLAGASSVEEALVWVRQTQTEAEVVSYLYLTDSDARLAGVVSLRRLLVAESQDRLEDLAQRQLVRVDLQTPTSELVRLVARYHLLALPVVDAEERLVGVITIHDVLASLLPDRER